MNDATTGHALTVWIPGHGRFTLTGEAARMIGVFGGLLHCHQGNGGCRKQGLYFSRTEPKKPLRCQLMAHALNGDEARASPEGNLADSQGIAVSVSHELAPKLDGGLPAVKGPACTCLRSFRTPSGKRSPCLDDQGLGLTDL